MESDANLFETSQTTAKVHNGEGRGAETDKSPTLEHSIFFTLSTPFATGDAVVAGGGLNVLAGTEAS